MNTRMIVALLLWTQGAPAELPVVKLKPKIREIPLEKVEPKIPFKTLKAFLLDVYVTSDEAIRRAPHVVAVEDRRLIAGTGDLVYIRPEVPPAKAFALYRPAKALKDPETGDILGYRLLKVADVRYLRGGDPTTFQVTSSRLDIHPGDLLLPKITLTTEDLKPEVPEREISGRIIDVLRPSLARYGRYDLVLINRGRRDGLRRGHLLTVWNHHVQVRDPTAGGWVTLPSEEAGKILIVETFERVSYGLVPESRRPLRPFDRVASR